MGGNYLEVSPKVTKHLPKWWRQIKRLERQSFTSVSIGFGKENLKEKTITWRGRKSLGGEWQMSRISQPFNKAIPYFHLSFYCSCISYFSLLKQIKLLNRSVLAVVGFMLNGLGKKNPNLNGSKKLRT